MAHHIDLVYESAEKAGRLPGIAAIAGDKDGNKVYDKSFGRVTLREGRDDPFTSSTICMVASMTKIMTAVAALQCVEAGLLQLDQDTRPLLPDLGKYGIITGFNDDTNSPILVEDNTPITLRMLLCHTSGCEYDFLNPLLARWRASRNEEVYSGQTVADKSALPLTYKPGTGFAYSPGNDWTGKAIEAVTKLTLEDFMREHIWDPLGISEDTSFFPRTKPGMKDRMAGVNLLAGGPDASAVDASALDPMAHATDCFGGGGLYTSANAYYTFLSAVFRRDPKLLTPDSYNELFRPQLDEQAEQALNDHFAASPAHEAYLALRIPREVRKTWSLAGLVAKDGLEGRFEPGCTLWAGALSTMWFMDHKAGVCGTACCQIFPPMHPETMELHAQFQRGVMAISKQ